ncbi:hypothetical protein ACFQS6_16265 [Xanthomonas populi]
MLRQMRSPLTCHIGGAGRPSSCKACCGNMTMHVGTGIGIRALSTNWQRKIHICSKSIAGRRVTGAMPDAVDQRRAQRSGRAGQHYRISVDRPACAARALPDATHMLAGDDNTTFTATVLHYLDALHSVGTIAASNITEHVTGARP